MSINLLLIIGHTSNVSIESQPYCAVPEKVFIDKQVKMLYMAQVKQRLQGFPGYKPNHHGWNTYNGIFVVQLNKKSGDLEM